MRQIRRYVPTSTFQKLVVALVHSRLDYGNGLLVGITAHLMRRIQSVLNAAARLIVNLKHSDHITDALVSLHWLRVPERIRYKIAVLSYKVLHDTAPRYLTYLVDEHSALPAPIASKYLISNFPPSAAELFRFPPHRSGTHYQKQSFWHQHCGRSSVIKTAGRLKCCRKRCEF